MPQSPHRFRNDLKYLLSGTLNYYYTYTFSFPAEASPHLVMEG